MEKIQLPQGEPNNAPKWVEWLNHIITAILAILTGLKTGGII